MPTFYPPFYSDVLYCVPSADLYRQVPLAHILPLVNARHAVVVHGGSCICVVQGMRLRLTLNAADGGNRRLPTER